MDYRVLIFLFIEASLAFILLYFNGAVRSASEILISSVLILTAFAVRACFFDYETTDYQWFLTDWVKYYKVNGGFRALADSVGNYNIPYLYFLSLFSYSSIRDLYLIKLLSCLFDVILAYSCMKILQNTGCSNRRSLVCFFLVLFLPTVIINGSVWGQCDSIYSSLAFWGIAIGTGGNGSRDRFRPILSMVCIALSFGFKLQAVFIMPAYLILWIWKKYKWYDFAVFPLTYLLIILPAVFLGRPIKDAVMLYADQANTVGAGLNYNSPSLTAFIHRSVDSQNVSLICILLAFLIMIILLFVGIKLRNKLSSQGFLMLTLLMVLLIPFLLPHMHDRYFFLADCLTVAFSCMTADNPFESVLRIISAVLMQFASLICYLAYLKTYYLKFGNTYLTSDKGAFAVLICIFIVAVCLIFSKRRISSDNA